MDSQACHCSCGNVAFDVQGTPLFRILCHCTICQRFNDAAFADVVVYSAAAVGEPAEDSVEFDTYKPPPNVQRGKCAQCHQPAIEKFAAPLFPKLTIVPSAAHADSASLPQPVAHIFYGTRVEDASDSLPKYMGFLASQLAFGKYLLGAKFAGS